MTRQLRWSLYWIALVHMPLAFLVVYRWPTVWAILGVNFGCNAVKIYIIEPLAMRIGP